MNTKRLAMLWLGIAGLSLFLPPPIRASAPPGDTLLRFDHWLQQTESALQALNEEHRQSTRAMRSRLGALNKALAEPQAQIPAKGYPLLLEKIRLEDELRLLDDAAELKHLRLRYRKGIEMLKLLYEKILSLDHHLTSLRTSQQIARIGNPHEYPEFKEIRSLLDERMQKKYGFGLPALLESNPYLAASYSIVSLALGGAGARQDKQQLEQLVCILDFTVRMNQQLNVIYFETEYLRDANQSLKTACEILFADCTRPLGYTRPLPYCREHDDWEQLDQSLDQYLQSGSSAGDAAQKKIRTNLRFSIDRIVLFLEKYCAFIAQGNEYYKKFAKIADSYEHEEHCAAMLPDTFNRLKNDIGITLEKFNSAYNLPELQGSRLKDLLYGIDD